jgi:hypothetical protein
MNTNCSATLVLGWSYPNSFACAYQEMQGESWDGPGLRVLPEFANVLTIAVPAKESRQ